MRPSLKTEHWIIAINAIVFLLGNILSSLGLYSLSEPLSLSFSFLNLLTHPWTLITYMFTHIQLGHVFWNLLLLYSNLRFFYTFFNSKQLWIIYISSGLAGGLAVLPLGWFTQGVVLGASASVLGMMALIASFAPNYPVNFWGLFEMRYKYLFALVFVTSTVIDLNQNAAGKLTHLGGALWGLFYAYYLKKGLPFKLKKSNYLRVVHRSSEERLNLLLDKISKNGYSSLSKKEREELHQLSKRP